MYHGTVQYRTMCTLVPGGGVGKPATRYNRVTRYINTCSYEVARGLPLHKYVPVPGTSYEMYLRTRIYVILFPFFPRLLVILLLVILYLVSSRYISQILLIGRIHTCTYPFSPSDPRKETNPSPLRSVPRHFILSFYREKTSVLSSLGETRLPTLHALSIDFFPPIFSCRKLNKATGNQVFDTETALL